MEKDTQNYFKGKKVTVLGLGLLGGALNDIKFLAEQGAVLTVTDLKSAEELAPSVEALKEYDNITYALGEHRLEDFQDADFVLQPGNVPTDSPYLLEAKKNNIPVHVSESLFAEHVQKDVVLVGVTGTRGKSTVTQLIYETLVKFPPEVGKVHLAGNVKDTSTLALLDKVSTGDVIVMELDSWALHGMGDIQKSPHIAVFTTFMVDHMNFYKGDLNAYLSDKANIFRFQKEDDVLVLGEKVVKILGNSIGLDRIVPKKIIASPHDVPKEWSVKIPGEHNLYNIACAVEALRALGLRDTQIQEGVEAFTGVEGRLQLVAETDGVKIYNDTTATTPDATLAGLRAVSENNNVVLIAGGTDKQIEVQNLVGEIAEHVKAVVLLPGTGTEKMFPQLVGKVKELHTIKTLEEAVKKARELAIAGDVILFSPGFASFGLFVNEYDRGEQFDALIKSS